jgi:hypothetical protein
LIATSQPHEIEDIVKRYENDLESTETNYVDLILNSGGAISYQDVMTMPVPTLGLMIKRINENTEKRVQAMRKQQVRR